MINIVDYIELSKTSASIKETITKPDAFSKNYNFINGIEKKSFLRHYIVNNSPFLFQNHPILFEQLTQYLADKLEINPCEIKLIGSAKTGFSISAPPDYGKPFTKDSDLDFSIINDNIFNSLQEEFNSWADQYKNGIILPKNETEEFYWNKHLVEVPNYQLKNGMVDTYKIPNYTQFEFAQKINQSLFLIKKNLEKYHSIEIKGASARVYSSWGSFTKQIKTNTESVLAKLK
ncbi:MAG: hypothetical protein NT126_03990 [Bacteroidetes bacterium]|nr:hypothetical protein [Bacteroidota bacterium]